MKDSTTALISRLKLTAFAKLAEVTPRAACLSHQADPPRGSLPAGRGPAALFSFVPAHSGSQAAAIAAQISRLQMDALGTPVLLANFDARRCAPEVARTPSAFAWGVISEVDGVDVLEANLIQPDQVRPNQLQAHQLQAMLDYARANYPVVCADLTAASESHAAEVLRASDGIFLVSGSGQKSLEAARATLALLRSLDLAERTGLLLASEPGGSGPVEAEEITGVPVCSLIDTEKQLERLAGWLVSGIGREPDREVRKLAIAV